MASRRFRITWMTRLFASQIIVALVLAGVAALPGSTGPRVPLAQAQIVYTGNPSADLDQCRNGTAGTPNACEDLGGSDGWVNGNVGAQQAHLVEGYSIPYRLRMQQLPASTVVHLVMGYDTRHSSKNAIDYLTYVNRLTPHDPFGHSPEVIDPCDGTTNLAVASCPMPVGGPPPPSAVLSVLDIGPLLGCGVTPAPACTGGHPALLSATPASLGADDCVPTDLTNACLIPLQPVTSQNALPANEKQFVMVGGILNDAKYVQQQPLLDDQSETQFEITFTTQSCPALTTPGCVFNNQGDLLGVVAMIAWGGHIATRVDWGFDGGSPESAGGVSGSPYHMRTKGWTFESGLVDNLGNQDRSLSAAAIFTTPLVTTVIHNAAHQALPPDGTAILIGGEFVHDSVTVVGNSPTGTVTFKYWSTNAACSGTPTATSSPFTLVNGSVDATTFAQELALQGGVGSFQAHYNGDTQNLQNDSPCEPFGWGSALGTITGRKFLDTDPFGAHSPTENGLAGWRIRIFAADCTTEVTTDAFGNPLGTILTVGTGSGQGLWSTPQLEAGTYCVKEDLAAQNALDPNDLNYIQTYPNGDDDGTDRVDNDNGTWTVTVHPADSVTGSINFGNIQPQASIGITPANATNEVGTAHTFTIAVTAAPTGYSATINSVTPSISPAIGFVTNTCPALAATTTTGTATCEVSINSNAAGVFTLNASTSLTWNGVGGSSVTLTRDTDPATATIEGPGGTGPAIKTYVDANITITGTATNEVGVAHTFTVAVNQNPGTGSVPAPVGHVDVTLTNSNGAAAVVNAAASSCDDAGDNLTDAGQCIVVFTSATAGTVTGDATVTLTVGGVALTRDTIPTTVNIPVGAGGSETDAVKTFVDANIAIGPASDTNGVGENHTFTVTVQENAGGGAGFVAALIGNVDVTLTNSSGATAVLNAALSSCDDNQPSGDNLDANGQCVVVFTSPTAGTVTGDATVTLTVGGLALTRDTIPTTVNIPVGAGGSEADAVKVFVDGTLRWIKHDQNGQLLAGATFEVCRTHSLLAGVMTDIVDVCVSVSDDSDGVDGPVAANTDQDGTGGEFLLTNLILGRYTVRETAAPPGYTIVNPNAVIAPDMTLAAPNVSIATPFVNTIPGEGCTPGFWKTHTSEWPVGYATTDLFYAEFGNPTVRAGVAAGITLLQALELGGGDFQALARHGTAALLSAADTNVNFPFTEAQVIALVRDAFNNNNSNYNNALTLLTNANELNHVHCGAA